MDGDCASGPLSPSRGSIVVRVRWHSPGVSANEPNLGRALALGQLECQCADRIAPGARHGPCAAVEMAGWPAVDVGIVRTLGSPDGRAILRALPPYDERAVMRLGDRLRREGHDADLVAALLTQQRLQASQGTVTW